MRHVIAGFMLAVLLVPSVVAAQASESIASFRVQADVQENRQLTVTEEITYDFGATERHGIFREIPVRYERNGGTYRLRIEVEGVTMDGQEVPWKIDDTSPLIIRIGDADQTITGRHVYTITYRTNRAINFFDGEAEFYWNVTGNGWEVPIAEALIAVRGPNGFEPANAPVTCFIGAFGSTEQGCTVSQNGAAVVAEANRLLRAGEGMTIAVRFPPGLIAEPTAWDQFVQLIADNWTLGIPVLVFFFMFWRWYTRGREPKGKGTVVPQYAAPNGMSPAEMVSLRDQQVPTQTVTATLIDLARRGYLTIEFGEVKKILKTEQTYAFVKQRQADGALSEAERHLFDGLFGDSDRVELEDLKGSFYKAINAFKKAVMHELQTRALFTADPTRVRATYIGVGVGMMIVLFWFLIAWMTPLTIAAIVLSAASIAGFGYFMPQKTKKGAIALEEIEGFKWFLSVTEAERLTFHNAPAMKPEQFHQFLPAAIALGVEKQWAGQFKGMDIPPPSYATGLHHWNALYFASAMSNLNHAAVATAYAPPASAGSGGSGFSGGGVGGGFGGGGGGSW